MQEQETPLAETAGSSMMTTADHQNTENENKQAVDLQKTEEDIIAEKSMRYEYYIHYWGIDRRSEWWVTEHYIRVDDQDEIARQKKIIMDEEAQKK